MASRARRFLLAIADFVVAALLVWASWPHSRNYYILLRFLVCTIAGVNIYFLFKPRWPISAIFAVIILLFNPVAPFNFAKATWTKIDLVVAVIFGILGAADSMLPGWPLYAVLLFGVSALSIVYGAQTVMSAIRLTDGVKVEGRVVDVTEDEVDSESSGSGIVYTATYQFTAQDGKVVTGSSDRGGDIGEAVMVIYNPSDPGENRLEDDSSKTMSGAVPRLLFALLFAVGFGWAGIGQVRKGLKTTRIRLSPSEPLRPS